MPASPTERLLFMTTRLAARGLIAALALALAACSSGSSSSASASASASASTATQSEVASASATESSSALPSFDLPNSDAELEALLPDQIGGKQTIKSSMKGSELLASGSDNQKFIDFLNSVGAQPDDVSVAFAFAVSTTADSTAVAAFRVKGVDHSRLLTELTTAMQDDQSATNFTDATVGGKSVKKGTAPGEQAVSVYIYGVADLVFSVTSASDDAAAEVLSHLP
jgi:hypothetical protein